MKAGIYLITSPSGSRYVGQAVNLQKRINEYKGLHCKEQTYLYNSFKKYGFEQHKITFLFECNFDDFEREVLKDLLNDLETEFILAYKTFRDHDPKGMNLTTGGGVCVYSEQTKAKMSESQKKYKNRPEARARNSAAQKIAQNRPEVRARKSAANKGKTHTAEAKAKMSEAQKGKIITEEAKARISKFQKGKIVTEETKAKMSEAAKGNKKCLGRIYSAETKALMSEAKKGNNNPLHKRNLKRYNDRLAYAKSRKDLNEPLNVPKIIGVQKTIF